MSENFATRSAFGRIARLGSVYDTRRDDFNGMSALKKEASPTAIERQDRPSSTIHLVNSESLFEKFSKMDVQPEEQASLLAGLVKSQGAARYLVTGQQTGKIMGSLIFHITTVHESLKINHEDLRDAISVEALQSGTHVVTGITFGATTILSCFYNNKDNRDRAEMENKLKNLLEKLKLAIDSQTELDLEENEGITYGVELFGDVLPKSGSPTTVEGALAFLKQLPGLVDNNNGGIGKPLLYHLTPATVLQNYLYGGAATSDIGPTIDDGLLMKIVQLFDDTAKAQQKVNDFHEEVTENKFCIREQDLEEVTTLKRDLLLRETKFRGKLATLLPGVRSGRSEVFELEALLDDFPVSKLSPENITTTLNNWTSITSKMKMAKAFVNYGAKYIGVGNSLDDELFEDFDSKVVVFFFTQKSPDDTERWRGNRLVFVQQVKQKEANTKFYVVDCDIHSGLMPKGKSSCVQLMEAGCVVNDDILENKGKSEAPKTQPENSLLTPQQFEAMEKERKNSTASSSSEGTSSCANKGVNDDAPMHKLPEPETLQSQLLRNLPRSGILNILILGETGVGKSTWINGFINYLTYSSLADAENGDLLSLIPSKFTVHDEKFEEITVTTGVDRNEVLKTGQSATQGAKVHPFRVGDLLIQLIDTPGIGDTRGTEQDKENFKNILDTLSDFDEIHGICILLKPNNARIGVMFKFCIKELLTYLHKDASRNIIFCFTNSRGTFYKPGDTMPALKELLATDNFLKDNQDVKIRISVNTVYCFDSEAYRFLAAVKNNPPVYFPASERDNFSVSWRKSIEETVRMLEYISSLAPHKTQSTLSLNYARELVLKLVGPMAEVTRINQRNRSIIEDEKREIQQNQRNVEQLKKNLMKNRADLEIIEIDFPKTVCSDDKCRKVWNVGNDEVLEYTQICHDHCFLEGIKSNTIGDPGLMKCWSMNGSDHCRHPSCGHSYLKHLHVYFETRQVMKEVRDEDVSKLLNEKMGFQELKQKIIAKKNDEIQEYDYELKEIEKASVRFAHFLKNNAITPYNDAYEQYVNHLIGEEEHKVAQGGSRTILENLQRSKESYLLQKGILEKEMSKGVTSTVGSLTAADIENTISHLKTLKHSGATLAKALNCVQQTRSNASYSNIYSGGQQLALGPSQRSLLSRGKEFTKGVIRAILPAWNYGTPAMDPYLVGVPSGSSFY